MGVISRFFVWATSAGTKRTALVDDDGHPQVDVQTLPEDIIYCDTDDVYLSGDLPAGENHIGEVDVEVKKYAPDTPKAEIAISDSQVQIVRENTDRKEVLIQNVGDEDVFLGPTGVASSQYFVKLSPGDAFVDDRLTGAWFGICASGKSSTISCFEIGSDYPVVA